VYNSIGKSYSLADDNQKLLSKAESNSEKIDLEQFESFTFRKETK